MPTRTYDVQEVIITFAGQDLSGFASGSFINAVRDADAYTKHTGADGVTTRIRSRNISGAVTVTLAQSSPSNDFLSSQAQLDEVANGGSGPLTIKDLGGATLVQAQDAWVRKIAEGGFSDDNTDREWVLDTGPMPVFLGGNVVP